MKNLNPESGLKQITKGSIFLYRYLVLKLIRGGKLKPSELGLYLIFVCSADWDVDKYRKGLIRYELPLLSKILQIPYSTLLSQLNSLNKKGLIEFKKINNQRVPSIVNFDFFTSRAQKNSTELNLKNEELKNFFPELLSDSEIQEPNQITHSNSFKDSFKDNLSDDDKEFINNDLKANEYNQYGVKYAK